MKNVRDNLVQELFETMSTMKRGMHGHLLALDQDSPVSRSQFELLFTVEHAQPVSSKQVAQQLHLTPGAVSQLLEPLEQGGFIERQVSETDRRIQYLQVSARGETLIRSFEKNRRKMMETVIADLTDEELVVWLRVQNKMIEFFQTQAKSLTPKEK